MANRLHNHAANGVSTPENATVHLDITNEPDAITGLRDAIAARVLPETYVRHGGVVRVGLRTGDEDGALYIEPMTEHILRRLLARHIDVYRWVSGGKDKPAVAKPASPAVAVCKAVLSETDWTDGKMPTLAGVVRMPVLRPDGSLLQTPGYDETTKLYYHPTREIPEVPETPDADAVAQARTFLLDDLLGDFLFDTEASKANYIALLMTPILRSFVGGLAPLGAINATMPGSGKTLLTDVFKSVFGMSARPWKGKDEEVCKVITTSLMTTAEPVILFDNVGEMDVVDAPSLAMLLTADMWDDRILGGSEGFRGPNDRLWLLTGNAIKFGGDIASRTVLVTLDPRMPNPEMRSGFQLGNLDEWLRSDANRARLAHALLVLALDWVSHGAPRGQYVMRTFTGWARALGGFLEHHGVAGFLANAGELQARDDEAATWAGFLAEWRGRFGDAWRTAKEARDTAEAVYVGFGMPAGDPWRGHFLTDARGNPANARSLGRQLAGKRGRFYGGLRLEWMYDAHEKTNRYRVMPYEPGAQDQDN
jgi:hypothetical protein